MFGSALRALGGSAIGLLADVGAIWRLALAAGTRLARAPFRKDEPVRARATLDQLLVAGNRSLGLVVLICALTGMIMALQSAYQLQQLGAVELVPSLVAVSITRELAALLTAIIVAGRFGSAIAAELGTMTVSQEIDALQVMGIDPISFLVVPRLVALLVAMPCLTVFADVVGILGGMVVGVGVLGLGSAGYVSATFDALALQDVFTGVVKSAVFAVIIGLEGCHQGLTTRGGAQAVGRSTTASVVRSIVWIVLADLFVTALFYARS